MIKLTLIVGLLLAFSRPVSAGSLPEPGNYFNDDGSGRECYRSIGGSSCCGKIQYERNLSVSDLASAAATLIIGWSHSGFCTYPDRFSDHCRHAMHVEFLDDQSFVSTVINSECSYRDNQLTVGVRERGRWSQYQAGGISFLELNYDGSGTKRIYKKR